MALAIAGIGDRYAAELLLRGATALKAILLTLATVTAAVDGPALGVSRAGRGQPGLEGAYRPLQAATLPWLVRTPAELTAANVVASMMEAQALSSGRSWQVCCWPWLTLRRRSHSAAVFFGFAWLSLLRLTVESRRPASKSTRVLHDMVTGVKALSCRPCSARRRRDPRCRAGRSSEAPSTVLIAVLAVDVLVLGEQAVELAQRRARREVAWSVRVVAAAIIRVTRLGRSFIAGVLLWGLPLVLLSLVMEPAVAYLAFIAIGIVQRRGRRRRLYAAHPAVEPAYDGEVLGVLELAALGGSAWDQSRPHRCSTRIRHARHARAARTQRPA